ncbi:capsid and scaffold protein [Shigella phage SFP20]|uniref:Capsid and scaffold protein n=1 Tax=Shigella phage SFP20 TaxID=3017289 RepID=A0AAE9VVU2_9CAUD|nr:capsid and scaffold protein [Shigella phage SFP20]
MGKSISKAFKKVVGGALNTVGLGPSAPQPKAQEQQVAAAPVDVPQDQVTDVETDVTETDKKKVKATGKRGLQVSRTSGGGISI